MKTRPKKEMIGTAECSCCKREIPARMSDSGTLNLSCHWCDLPLYAKAGTEAHRILLARVVRKANEELPTPTPEDKLPEKPIARAAKSFFEQLAGQS